MIKILYLINYAGKAGTEKYVYNLCRKYHKKCAECFFVYNEAGPLCEQIEELGIVPKRIVMKNPFDISAARELAKYCGENGIDVIHAQYPRENYIAILAKHFYKSVKVVYTSHLTIKTGLVWRLANSVMTKKNHKIISVCNYGKELLLGNGFPKDKIEVIFNGVRPEEKSKPPIGFKESLGIDEDTFVISILARYEHSKGLDFLIRSIKRLTELTDRKFVLLIVGDGVLYDEISKMKAELSLDENVKQLGFRKDTGDILAVSDLYVNSSKCLEALSFAMVEALQNGLPIVATDVGGNSDIVSPENNCGTLVQFGDEETMAAAICELMENENKRLAYGKNARLAAEQVFNLDKLLDDTFKVYM